MTQLTLEKIVNMNLFSNHYLENLIQRNPEWKRDDHEKAFHRIKQIYQREMSFLEGLNESQLEERFFKQIFKVVLPDLEVQATTETADFPDYAFFPDRKTLDNAHKEKGKKSFYIDAFAIGEVKKWGAELDRFGRDKHNKRRNPSFQIWLYLHETEPKWGILSNGRKWRLYHQDKPLDYYYEIDLIALLETDDIEGFRYFYYFFRREAFLPSEEQDAFLNRVLKESADYAKEIGDNLKENIYRAMKIIADGFLHWSQNNLDTTRGEIRAEVQASTMRLLYRLLFLLYAEGKGLLSLKDEQYRRNHSFYRIKKEIAERKGGPSQDHYSPASTSLWSNLKDLFRLIDQGSEAFGIPKNQFHVPAYNGGLFEAKRNPNLERWTIGDTYLADAIDLLARSKANGGEMAFVDYSTLEIQHLGSIYEGLLEYKLKIAETDLVVKEGRKKREWDTLEEFNKGRKAPKSFEDFDEFDKVQTGKLYLATEKGERKATGSYYTPDYIVNYIVENTVGPVVKERWKNAREKEESLVDATLSINVLDPAMGSGHFLVGAIEFLAGKLLEAAQKDIEAGLVEDDDHFTADWAKREVVSHCIYGVDLNYLAVELAKVSLWLSTISKDKPLSFLDHRLKQGNSLIGSKIVDLAWVPGQRPKGVVSHYDKPFGLVEKILEKLKELEAIPDDTLDEIRKKEELFNQLKESDEYRRLKSLADVHTGLYFEDIDFDTIRSQYMDLVNEAYYGNPQKWEEKFRRSWVQTIMRHEEEKKFFHWELEFPETFFEEGKLKENPGFDAVVGNPPYVSSENMEKTDRHYFMDINAYETVYGKFDIFLVFIEKGMKLLSQKSNLGYIVPFPFLSQKYGNVLRKYILSSTCIKSIVDLSSVKVFEDATVSTCIFILEEESNESRRARNKIRIIQTDKEQKNPILNPKQVHDIHQHFFYNIPNNKFRVEISPDLSRLIEKMVEKSTLMANICYIITGAVVHDGKTGKSKNALIYSENSDGTFKKYVEGKEVNRYSYMFPERYLHYFPDKMHRPKFPELFENKKILVRNIVGSLGLIATVDCRAIYCDHSLCCCVKKSDLVHAKRKDVIPTIEEANFSEKYNVTFLASLINSKLLRMYFRIILQDKLHVYPEDLRSLPIRCINFTTSPDRRSALMENAKQFYQEYLTTKDQNHVLDFIEGCLPKDKGGNFLNEKEKSDVVHDLLAYLAEQMMEMNRAKNKEVNGFIDWLGTGLGVGIETLTNRTKLKQYHEFDFDGLLAILKKNKKNIPVNVSSREFQDNLKREFEKSLGVLSPLRKRIEATDKLIDQIVYKLYGLTEDEIEVVEGAN